MEKIKLLKSSNIIQVELPDGRILEGPRGATVEMFLKPLAGEFKNQLMGAIVNKELRELGYVLESSTTIEPVLTSDSTGKNIYRRSLVYLLTATFEKLLPKNKLTVDHSIHSGGLFCKITGPRLKAGKEFYTQLENEMRKTVERDLPIYREMLSIEEAKALFLKKKHYEKYQLLKYRKKNYLTIYRLENFIDYHYGYMVPSTGYLRIFAIEPASAPMEFFLRFPETGSSAVITKRMEAPKMMSEFRLYGDWLKRLEIDSIAALNQAVETNRIQEVILVSEALHEQKFVQIARAITTHKPRVRVVLIAGPSSSGKTTFSKRLSIELLALGVSPVPIEMDDFFVDRELSPKAPDGSYDFESVENLNIPLMDDRIQRLINGEEVQLPKFDFLEGKSKPGKVLRIHKDQIIILEGIHGMNPKLLPAISKDLKYQIYASPLTQVNLDRYNRVSTVDTRLIRRTVRDFRERGYSAQDTLARWGSVRAGEEKYIIPYQKNADQFCNTSLVYELSALKSLAETALRQVPWGTHEYVEAKRLLSFLEWVLPIPEGLVPANSILAEFIGGSNLQHFTVWKEKSGNRLMI